MKPNPYATAPTEEKKSSALHVRWGQTTGWFKLWDDLSELGKLGDHWNTTIAKHVSGRWVAESWGCAFLELGYGGARSLIPVAIANGWDERASPLDRQAALIRAVPKVIEAEERSLASKRESKRARFTERSEEAQAKARVRNAAS